MCAAHCSTTGAVRDALSAARRVKRGVGGGWAGRQGERREIQVQEYNGIGRRYLAYACTHGSFLVAYCIKPNFAGGALSTLADFDASICPLVYIRAAGRHDSTLYRTYTVRFFLLSDASFFVCVMRSMVADLYYFI